MIIDYGLVRGLPGNVEERVQHLLQLRNGWQPKGNPTVMTLDGCEIMVQCMVQYENEKKA